MEGSGSWGASLPGFAFNLSFNRLGLASPGNSHQLRQRGEKERDSKKETASETYAVLALYTPTELETPGQLGRRLGPEWEAHLKRDEGGEKVS